MKARTGPVASLTMATISLLVAACGSSSNGTDSTPPPTAAPSTTINPSASPATSTSLTTTSPTTTTTTATTIVVTTTEAEATVGSREAFLAEAQEVIEFLGRYVPDPDNVPLPDPTNADAAIALKTIFEFEFWTLATAPDSIWADIYALPPTQAWVDSSNLGGRLSSLGAVFEFRGAPYQFHTARVVQREETGVPDEAFTGLPEESVVVEYESSIGPYEIVTLDTGQVWDTFFGWDRKPRYVVMSPTDSGWRVAWIGPVE